MTGIDHTSPLLGYTAEDLLVRQAGHTAREIAQQPQVWRDIAADDSGTGPRAAAAFAAAWRERAGATGRIVLTGAGTSAFAGRVLAPELAGRLGRRVDAVATTDIVGAPRSYLAEAIPTLLVSFARSGDSPESVAATELADQLLGDVTHLIVTCNPDGHLAREHTGRSGSQVLMLPPAANDRSFAMTSSFTGMTLAALLALGGDGEPGVDVDALATAAQSVLDGAAEDVRRLAAGGPQRLVYLGSGPLTGLTAEAALKALELTAGGVVALGDSSLGFRHGPKSVISRETIVVVFVSGDPYTRRYDLDIVAELARTVDAARLRVVTDDPAAVPGEIPVWPLPALGAAGDGARALPGIVWAQQLALALSLERGITPDNPFPSGEVNRVVQGVTVHPLDG